MITVLMKGGLGNQMFRFAAGRRLSIKHSTSLRLAISWHVTEKGRRRPFLLENYSLSGADDVVITTDPWGDIKASGEGALYEEGDLGFCREVLDLPDPSILSGHFGDARYFSDISETVRRDFQLRDKARADHVSDVVRKVRRPDRPLVSVHVRRGDYLDVRPDGGLLISVKRIQGAMAHFPNADFLVFSDDIGWCRENLQAEAVDFSPLLDGVDDMAAMAACDHHIIANSTFSWWGAWLNSSPSKTVLFPDRWHGGNWPGPAGQFDAIENANEMALPDWIPY